MCLIVFGGRGIISNRDFLHDWGKNGRKESDRLFVSLNRSKTIHHCLGLCRVMHFVHVNWHERFHLSCPRLH
jgi:hypothetical protein